jgi:hypothetical protein
MADWIGAIVHRSLPAGTKRWTTRAGWAELIVAAPGAGTAKDLKAPLRAALSGDASALYLFTG